MRYPTNDANGHVRDRAERDKLQMAVNLLNVSDTVAAIEENANHHHAADFRTEMGRSFHVAEVERWFPSPWDSDYEVSHCLVCGGEVERELEREVDGTS